MLSQGPAPGLRPDLRATTTCVDRARRADEWLPGLGQAPGHPPRTHCHGHVQATWLCQGRVTRDGSPGTVTRDGSPDTQDEDSHVRAQPRRPLPPALAQSTSTHGEGPKALCPGRTRQLLPPLPPFEPRPAAGWPSFLSRTALLATPSSPSLHIWGWEGRQVDQRASGREDRLPRAWVWSAGPGVQARSGRGGPGAAPTLPTWRAAWLRPTGCLQPHPRGRLAVRPPAVLTVTSNTHPPGNCRRRLGELCGQDAGQARRRCRGRAGGAGVSMTPLHALTSGDPGPRPQSGHWFYLGGVVSGRRMDGQTDREGRRGPSLPLQASSPGLAASGARRPLYVTQSAHRTAFSFLLSSLQAEGRGPWRSGRNSPGPRQQLLPRSARPHRRPHSEGDQCRHPALPAPPSVSGTAEVRGGSALKHAKDPWGNPSGPVCLPGLALGPADRPPAVAPAPSTVASILGPLKAAAESRRALIAEQRCPPSGRPWGRQPLTGEAAGGGQRRAGTGTQVSGLHGRAASWPEPPAGTTAL